MNELKITLTNCPPQIAYMLETAFKIVPKRTTGQPLEIPTDGLAIDFKDVKDPEMANDLIKATNVIIMAQGWLTMQKRDNEKQGH